MSRQRLPNKMLPAFWLRYTVYEFTYVGMLMMFRWNGKYSYLQITN